MVKSNNGLVTNSRIVRRSSLTNLNNYFKEMLKVIDEDRPVDVFFRHFTEDLIKAPMVG